MKAELNNNQKLTKAQKFNVMKEVYNRYKDNSDARYAVGSVFVYDYLYGASVEDLQEVLNSTKKLLKAKLAIKKRA